MKPPLDNLVTEEMGKGGEKRMEYNAACGVDTLGKQEKGTNPGNMNIPR